MQPETLYHEEVRIGESPIVAIAPHAGSHLIAELEPWLTEDARRMIDRLQSPWTSRLTTIAPTRIWATRSRLEVDLDREREHAVGERLNTPRSLAIWRRELPDHVVARGLQAWDQFHARVARILDAMLGVHGHFLAIVLRAAAPLHENAPGFHPAAEAPEIVVQSGSVRGARWQPLLGPFIETLQRGVVLGYPLHVTHQPDASGGGLTSWINEHYGHQACALALDIRRVVVEDDTDLPEPFAAAQVSDTIRQAALRAAEFFKATEPSRLANRRHAA